MIFLFIQYFIEYLYISGLKNSKKYWNNKRIQNYNFMSITQN